MMNGEVRIRGRRRDGEVRIRRRRRRRKSRIECVSVIGESSNAIVVVVVEGELRVCWFCGEIVESLLLLRLFILNLQHR
jgi:hypothetical protein